MREPCRSWRKSISHTGLAVVILALPVAAVAAALPTRDQNPLLTGFGLPVPMPSSTEPAGKWSFAAAFNWGSTALIQSDDTQALIVDAETREIRLTVARALTDRIAVQLQIPYRYTGAGTLDAFIDGWHDFFSLPEGERVELPRDQIRLAYAAHAARIMDIRSSSSALGDISAGFGYRLLAAPASDATAWLNVKLPTGDSDKLTGSGAADVSLLVAGEHRFGQRWSLFGQAGVTWLGQGEVLADQQRSIVWSALAGAGWHVWRELQLKAQVDAHTSAFDGTGLDFLGDAVVLTIGGSYEFASGWRLDAGVSEDLVVEASPDVVLVIGMSRKL